ncbi:cytochrome P450 [Mycena galopus ATCC 62051]|nr:cytochrome P450 [Mycena galopus ATCC 62051]
MDYATTFAGFIAVLLPMWTYFVLRRSSAIRNIPGPPSPSWIFGNMLQLLLPPQYGDNEFAWIKKFGPVYSLKGCFGQNRLMISDPLALQYILNSPHFQHKCLMAAKGETHKRLRAAINIGFTSAAVRDFRPIFVKVAQKMTEELDELSGSPTDLCPILSHATLSTISEAALGYSTQDLGERFVVNNARMMTLSSSQSASQIIGDAIGARLPKFIWRAAIYLPTTTFKVIRTVKYLANKTGNQIVEEKLAEAQGGVGITTDVFGMLHHSDAKSSRDVALTVEELVAQTGLLMIAGQETVTNTLAFGFLELGRHPEFQEELRREIQESLRGSPHDFAYDSMPLLNAFIKETLRFYPAPALHERIAVQDTVIPLTKGIKMSTGDVINHIPVRKGQILNTAIASYQRLDSRWGEDGLQFRPSRWIDGSVILGQAIGPYANLLSFWGGPHVCLGILELQVFFSELVGKFSFSLPAGDQVCTRFANTLLPVIPSGEKAAPLCVTRS